MHAPGQVSAQGFRRPVAGDDQSPARFERSKQGWIGNHLVGSAEHQVVDAGFAGQRGTGLIADQRDGCGLQALFETTLRKGPHLQRRDLGQRLGQGVDGEDAPLTGQKMDRGRGAGAGDGLARIAGDRQTLQFRIILL